MYKVLIVDDEEKIRQLIKKYAQFEKFSTSEASDGFQAVDMVKREHFDVVLMDVMMPYMDGYTACSEIRKFSTVPIIILTARGDEYDRIHGFEVGVDDYVVKPFSPKELMLRIKAILSRNRLSASNMTNDDIYRFDGFTVNWKSRIVEVDGEQIPVTAKEFELLQFLIKNKNIALSREKIINSVWGYDYVGDDRTLDTHIKLLRKKLGKYSNLITTLRGVGYRFDE